MKYARISGNKLDRSQLFDSDQGDGAIYVPVPLDLDLSVVFWEGSLLIQDELLSFYKNAGNQDGYNTRMTEIEGI